MPVPPELRKLNVLVGDWVGTIQSDHGETSQAHSSLEASFRWILDGYHLEGILHHTIGNRTYEARLVWSYDLLAKRYRVYWINNFSSLPMLYSGIPQPGNTIEISGKSGQGSEQTVERVLLVFSKERWQMTVTSQAAGRVRAKDVLRADRRK